jgi:hypothetical protein
VFAESRELASTRCLWALSYSTRRKWGGVVHLPSSSDEKKISFRRIRRKPLSFILWFVGQRFVVLYFDGTVNKVTFDPLDRYLAVGCRHRMFYFV